MRKYFKKMIVLSMTLVLSTLNLSAVSALEKNLDQTERTRSLGIYLSSDRSISQVSTEENTIPLEIERKFLVNPDDLSIETIAQADHFELVQTYISYEPEVRVRQGTIQVNGRANKRYYFTMKLPKDEVGLSRSELEFQISSQVYQDLLQKQVGKTIYKTRLQFKEGEHIFSVDIYHGSELAGLAVAEVEFDNLESAQSFIPPKWLGLEVTADKRYKNANLAKNGKPKR